jgi:RNA polymerase sigma factor (sigma-70 family)
MSESRDARGSSEVEALVRRALGGDRASQRTLIEDELAPVVEARVARALLRRGSQKRELRGEMMDLCQQVFVHLFGGNLLARWDPAAGPLGAFVGAIAENHVRSILRSRVRSPFTEIATEQEAIELALSDGETEEGAIVTRQALRRLSVELSDEEREGFFAFFVDERSIEEMCLYLGKSREAVYKQRQRLRERVRRILDDEAQSSGRVAPAAAQKSREEGL